MWMVELAQVDDFSDHLLGVRVFFWIQLDRLDGIDTLVQVIFALHHRSKASSTDGLKLHEVCSISRNLWLLFRVRYHI